MTPDEYYRQQREKSDAAVKQAAFIASQPLDKTPDEYAQSARLAKSVNLPTAVIDPNYKTFAQKMVERRNEMLLGTAPKLTQWIAKDDNYKVAADDVEGLSWWENALIVPRGIASAIPAFSEGVYGLSAAVTGLPGKNVVSDWFSGQAKQSRSEKSRWAGPTGGWFGTQVQGASQSIGLMAPGILASIGTGGAASPAVAAAYIAPGAIVSGGTSAQKALDQGKSAGTALRYGALDAAAEAVFERMPVGRLLGDIAKGTGFGKMLAHQIATEVPSEVATTLYQNLNEYATLTPEKPFGDFLAEQPAEIRDTIAQTVLATVGLTGSIAGARRVMKRQMGEEGRVAAAEANQEVIGQISSQAQGSTLRTRLPGSFQEYVDQALKDGPVENVYVPAQDFVEYFQSQGIDPRDVVDELDGLSLDDLDAAIAGGSDLRIPTSTYAAKIAGTDADPFMMENMRFSPDEMTAREAAEFNAQSEDVMQEAWAEAERIRAQEESLRGAEEQIYIEMQSRLRQAGRTTDVANTEATLYPAFYRVMAERSGMATEDFLAKYPLPRVEGVRPEGMQTKDVTAFNRLIAEARTRRDPKAGGRGPSLLEFIADRGGINDPGGELRHMGADVVKRGKGKKTLRIKRDTSGDGQGSMIAGDGGVSYSADDVARAVVEAGFMADNPAVMEYQAAMNEGRETPDLTAALWDAIRDEAGGAVQYAGGVDFAAQDRERSLDDLEAYLNSLDVSLDSPDADIIAAVRQDEQAQRYAQAPVTTREDVEAFERGLEAELGLRSLSLFMTSRGDLKLNMLAVSKDKLGGGVGSQAMERIAAFADERGLRVTLTTGQTDKNFGTTSSARLVKFYKRFGFVENKGRNKDFSTSDNMLRDPQSGSNAPRLLFQDMGKGPRGSFQIPVDGIGNGDSIIRLSERADLSTFLHESGHYFLTVMQDMAANDPAIAAEFDTVKSWWRENAADVAKDARKAFPDLEITAAHVEAAIDNGTSGDVGIDAAIDVGMQEQWARGFETYAMEGKAPSADLRAAFERFRAWLLSIYRNLTGLNVNVSDDLRRVFDRMLATDEEIAQATQDAGGSAPMFATAEEMGLTDEEFDRFQKLRGQAEDEAKARLLKETMAPIKREREKWYKEERASVRETVEQRVNAYRQYRAMEWMGNRRWLGEGQPADLPDMRMSKDVLVERYGEGILKTLPRGKQTVYAVEGGLDPDEAAGWFGFNSGDEMLKAMEQAMPRKEAIDAETDKVMYEEHGDVLLDGTVEEEALAAVHNDRRGEWLAAELKAVTDVAGRDPGMTAKGARQAARQTMARMKVRDAMAANRFLAAERKAGQEAAKLGAMLAREGVWMGNARRRIATKARSALRDEGTVDAVAGQVEQANASTENYNETVDRLIAAKQRQLLNHALYSEARKVTEEVAKAERFVATLNKASKREKIAGAGRREDAQIDYLSAIDEVLDTYDFRRMSGRAEDRRGSLVAFVEAMKQAGRENELAIPDDVLANAQRTPYKTIPVEQLRGVIDSLKNLEHVALRWNELIDAKRKRDLDATANAIAEAIDHNLPHRPPGPVKTKGEKVRNTVRAYFDSVLNATTLLREMDGFKDRGVAYQDIKAPIDEAQDRLTVRKLEAAEKLEQLYAVYSKDERRAMAVRTLMPELGYSISKWEKIALALNTGNEGNLARLTSRNARRPFTDAQIAAVLGTLDARDAAFVQSVWDFIGSYKADIAARERRATGVEPAWVEATPVTIGGKELRGGYYPIKYDTRLSSLAADRETADIAGSLMAGKFGKAQTKNGHLKSRAESGDGSIDLDMAVMHQHINQVVYDLEMSEPVANAWRVLQDSRVRGALDTAGRSADFDALQSWLKDAAEGELGATSQVGAVLRGLKSNFTAAKLALNISNAILQATGVTQSFVVVGKKDMAVGIAKWASNPAEAARQVVAASPFMASRQTTFNKDVMDFYSDPRHGQGASRYQDFKRNIWGPLSFWLMQKVQFHTADVPTWIAGYGQGMRKFGNDEAKAIAHADGLVKRAQASGLWIDRSAIERGSLSSRNRQNDIVKLFTTLGSYMFAKFNVAYERSAVASQTIRAEGVSVRSAQEVASWTLDMVFLFTIEAVIMAAVKGGLPGGEEDDEGWAKWLAKKTAFNVLGTLPFIRDGVSVFEGHGGGGAYGSVMEETGKGLLSSAKITDAMLSADGEVKKTDVKNIVNATGVATGAPTVFINRIVDAGWRDSEGEEVSPLEYIFGKSKK